MKSPTGRNKKVLLQFHLQHSLSRFEMMVDHIQTLLVRLLKGGVGVHKGPGDGGRWGGKNRGCRYRHWNWDGGNSRWAVVERALFVWIVMLTGASGEVDLVNSIMACSFQAVEKGITTELIGHHIPSVIFHLPDHGAGVIHVVPHFHLIHSLKDQQIPTV